MLPYIQFGVAPPAGCASPEAAQIRQRLCCTSHRALICTWPEGFEIAGTPIGTRLFIAQQLQQKADEI